MNTQTKRRTAPPPEYSGLRRLRPEDDYIDFLHDRAQGPKPRGKWLRSATLICLLLAAFLYAGPLLRLADPTAATADAGALSLVLLALLGVTACHLLACLLAAQLYRSLNRLTDRLFYFHFKNLKPWQHLCIYLSGYASSFWGMALWLLRMM